ncbi:septal ring lytic transglycosylase RlpA family protein [Stenoxybacter acetivorans]|uniref:septal ring lytic transglycosylase RlpA family protein n=1 Tax=Stenoxybacter acetivorans TaxID=422441 RepID=UPI00056D1B01|nr:septal ring lytic transglycosylase RlpA family protein [Stenoxybacter acetivorans]
MKQVKNIFFATIIGSIALGSGLMTTASAKSGSVSLQNPQEQEPKTADLSELIPNAAVKFEALHKTANKSYQVAGKRYYPLQELSLFKEKGNASWYGPGFHGRKTSSGERYDMNMMTAAHPTLPIPSYAKVTNLTNGKSVVVRINDRGPFHGNRVLDVSKAAAQKLGFLNKGTAEVSVEQIVPAQNIHANIQDGGIYVDLQRFDSLKDAQAHLSDTIHQLKAASLSQKASVVKEKNSYLVRVGPFRQEQERADYLKKAALTEL